MDKAAKKAFGIKVGLLNNTGVLKKSSRSLSGKINLEKVILNKLNKKLGL